MARNKNKSKRAPRHDQIRRVSSVPKTEMPSDPADSASLAKTTEELARERSRLDELRENLQRLEQETEQQRRVLATEREGLVDKSKKLKRDGEELVAARRALEEERTKLAERLENIVRREMAAEEGFGDRNQKAIEEWESRLAGLRAAMSEAQAQLAEARVSSRAQLDAEIGAERAARIKQLEGELEELRERLLDDLAKKEAEQDARLQGERSRCNDERAQLEEQRAALENLQVEIRAKETEAQLEARLLEADREALEATVAKRIKEHVEDSNDRNASLERRNEALQRERETLQSRVGALESSAMRFGGRTVEDVEEEILSLRAETQSLKEKLERRPPESSLDRLRELEAERDAWDRTRLSLQRELAQLKGERHTWILEQAELERQRDLAESARRIKDALDAEAQRLDAEVQRLRSLYERPQEREARIGAIEKPRFGSVPPPTQDTGLGEQAWLDRIHERCTESGLTFPRRVLHAFHTSLKTAEWAPMTVLGGVSGTGKSELPRLYARFGGLAFEPLSVQPNWDSPQSLFGFFNSVDGRFNATPLLRALVQSQKHPDDSAYEGGLSDRVLLVLLDELNLSHVELYFSDLLSKLELRRGAREAVSLEIDLGPDEYMLPLGRNVLWVGTMNEDETTKSLSDKVLDRANMLKFPRPRELRRRLEASLLDPEPMLPFSIWEGWICRKSDLSTEDVGRYKSVLDQMNTHLEFAGRALGHRVWQSVESYMANYPAVRAAQAADDQASLADALKVAFEDALVQKVMPKLRGIETTGKSRDQCLDPIARLLADRELGLRLAEDFELATSVGYAFVWRSARYIEATG
jgi:hypothetical protein